MGSKKVPWESQILIVRLRLYIMICTAEKFKWFLLHIGRTSIEKSAIEAFLGSFCLLYFTWIRLALSLFALSLSTLSLSLYVSHTHSHTCTQTLSLSLTHTHTHAHIRIQKYTHAHTNTFAYIRGRSVYISSLHDVGHRVWIYEHVHSVARPVRHEFQYRDTLRNNTTIHHQCT